MTSQPIISIVLGTYNRKSFLRGALASIRKNNISVPYEIIVIDGGSTDGTLQFLNTQKDVITIIQHNHGKWMGKVIEKKNWGHYMNIAFRAAQGKYVVMISDDCLLIPNSVMNAFTLFEEEISKDIKLGGVAFYWRNYPYEKLYYVRQTLGHKLSVNHGMFLKEALEKVGYCDEVNFPFYYGDGDLSLKLWEKGYSICDCKDAFVEHFHYAAMKIRQKNSINKEKHKIHYMRKWASIFYDPKIDNQSGKIFLSYFDKSDIASIFRKNFWYYLGIIQSKFGWVYGYTKSLSEHLPSLEMLSNEENLRYILDKKNIDRNHLCFFALIKKENTILLGSKYDKNGQLHWTFPGGRSQDTENCIKALGREIEEEIGIKDVKYKRVIAERKGILLTDQVYFIECEINEEPKLSEPEKFSSWEWFSLENIPKNLLNLGDLEIIRKILN